MPAFGRRVEFDEASRRYPIRTLLRPALRTSKMWDCYAQLDQGNVGACVGFSWAGELAATPEAVPGVSDSTGTALYDRAQLLDQWADTPPEEGSSVLAGAKAVTEAGWLAEYRWAFGLDDLLDALSQFGPAVLGIPWLDGMMSTDAAGFIHAIGGKRGGHAILARGVNVEIGAVWLHNSWGPDWGQGGGAWISFDDLRALLADDGEACIPVVRTRVEPAPTPPEPEPVPEPSGCLSRQSIRSMLRRSR